MPEKVSISSRVSDFIFTTAWLSFFNFFVVYATYLDFTKRLTWSVLVAAAAGLILALTRPAINAWLKPLVKRNKNTNMGLLIRLILFTVFFGVVAFLGLLHLKEDSNWSMTKILTKSFLFGLVSGVFFTLLFWLIKIIRGNKTGLPNTDR